MILKNALFINYSSRPVLAKMFAVGKDLIFWNWSSVAYLFSRFSAGFNFAHSREFNQNPRNSQNLIPAKFNPIKVNSSKKLLLFGESTIEATIFRMRFKYFPKDCSSYLIQKMVNDFCKIKNWIFDQEFSIWHYTKNEVSHWGFGHIY